MEMPKKYKLVPVDALPPGLGPGRGSKFDPVIDSFLSKGAEVVMLNAAWPTGMTNGDVESIAYGIAMRIKAKGVDMHVCRRAGDIYLVRGPRPVKTKRPAAIT